MRKVTRATTSAFLAGKQLSMGNTVSTGNELLLHGNCIAKRVEGKILISNAGWESNTTKERLNGLGAGIYQKNYSWYWKDGEDFPHNTFVEL